MHSFSLDGAKVGRILLSVQHADIGMLVFARTELNDIGTGFLFSKSIFQEMIICFVGRYGTF
jgi:hypothetical protein